MVSNLTFGVMFYFMAFGEARIKEPSCNYMENLERLLEKYVRYEHTLDIFKNTLAAWETKLDAKLKQLDTTESERNQHIDDIESSMEKLKQGIDEDRASLQKESERVETRLERKQTEVNQTLAVALQKHAEDLRSIQETYSTITVYFSAKYVTDYDLSVGKKIKFTTIISNVGDGYDSSTGEFTAPHTGLYIFTTTLCANHKKNVFAQLMAADTALAAIRNYNGDASGTCTSMSGVAKLEKGEKAWVLGAYSTYNGVLCSNNGFSWPSFSGILVHV